MDVLVVLVVHTMDYCLMVEYHLEFLLDQHNLCSVCLDLKIIYIGVYIKIIIILVSIVQPYNATL